MQINARHDEIFLQLDFMMKIIPESQSSFTHLKERYPTFCCILLGTIYCSVFDLFAVVFPCPCHSDETVTKVLWFPQNQLQNVTRFRFWSTVSNSGNQLPSSNLKHPQYFITRHLTMDFINDFWNSSLNRTFKRLSVTRDHMVTQ